MNSILLIEDEALIQEMIKEVLEIEGYNVITASDGKTAIEKFEQNDISLVILDIMIPKIDGFSVLRKIRKQSNIYVIILSAREMEDDILFAYELGADDYITKPFSPKILTSRVNNLFKRLDTNNNFLEIKGIKLEVTKRTITVNSKLVNLRKKEFDLLQLLMQNKGTVFTRDQILNKVWGYDFFGDNRVVDTVIKDIRKKLGDKSCVIQTVVGVGYKLDD